MTDSPKMPVVLTPLEYYNLFRSRIEHEDNLIVQRLSWLMASQSFLFTAYAITLNGLSSLPGTASATFTDKQEFLLRILPAVGALTGGLIYFGLLAAIRAVRQLRETYQSRFDKADAPLPDLMMGAGIRTMGFTAPLLVPVMFIVVWLALLFRT